MKKKESLNHRMQKNAVNHGDDFVISLRLAKQYVKEAATRGYAAGCDAVHRINGNITYDTHNEAVRKILEDPNYMRH